MSAACEPGDFPLSAPTDPPCGPNESRGMVVHDGEISWLVGREGIGPPGGLYRAPAAVGASLTVLWSGISGPNGLTLHGDDLVFAEAGFDALWTLTPPTTFSKLRQTYALWPRVVGDVLYWIGDGGRSLRRLDMKAGVESVLYEATLSPGGNGAPIGDFAVLGDYVYFSNCTDPLACSVGKIPTTGGAVSVLAEQQRYLGCLDTNGSRVFWNVVPPPVAGEPAIEIRAVATTGGAVASLGSRTGVTVAAQLLVDGQSLYAIDPAGIARLDPTASSSTVSTLARLDGNPTYACHQVATDAQYLYFLTPQGELRRVAK